VLTCVPICSAPFAEHLFFEEDLSLHDGSQNIGLVPPSHLTDEDPDQPQTCREKQHDDISDETEEAIALLLYDYVHDTSFRK